MARKASAAAVMVRGDAALLVRRSRPPDAGLWSYPGGHALPGESPAETAVRELREETGIVGRPLGVLTWLEIGEDPGFRLAMVLCAHGRGEPCAADDAAAARWVATARILSGDLPMSRDVAAVLRLALARG